jgi:O6-methylguanine-DNA--protein-cysteine methyltransferase
MPDYRFFIENVPTPTGTMLLVTDELDNVRALDWDDHAARMHRLLRLHYGGGIERKRWLLQHEGVFAREPAAGRGVHGKPQALTEPG